MLWRTVLLIHLVLTTLKLLRAECASRLETLSCAIVYSSSPLISFGLGSLGIGFALDYARGALGGLAWHWQAVGRVGRVVWEALGSSVLIEDVDCTRSLSAGLEERIPGAWDVGGGNLRNHVDSDPRAGPLRSPPKHPTCPNKRPRASVVDASESDSDWESNPSTLQNGEGLGSANGDTFTSPPLRTHPSPDCQASQGPYESGSAIDSSKHQDAMNLHAEDTSLLGQYLARSYGMFAWRVHPIIHLPGQAYPDGAETGLFQRIDAFMKPAGRVVHYAELLIEWVPPSCSEVKFFVQHAIPSRVHSQQGTSDDMHGTLGLRVIGARIHAFRARKCDPRETGRAEFFLNMLGLGTRWTCSWGWDAPLATTFDGLAYARRALDHAVVERWLEGARECWARAGRTLEEAEEWGREVEEFGWADGWESGSDDSDDPGNSDEEDGWTSEWTDEDGFGCSSGDGSELEFNEETDDGDEDEEDEDEERIGLVFSGIVDDAAQQLEPTPHASLQPVAPTQDVGLVDRPSSAEVDHEPEDVVLYPRKADLVAYESADEESDEEELILYEVPHAALAVYPPTLRTTPLADPLTELRPVFAPIPAHVAGARSTHETGPDTLPILPPSGDTGAIERHPPASSPSSSPSSSSDDEDSNDDSDDDARRLVLHNRTGHRVALVGNGRLIRMMHTLVLESTPGPGNGVRCVVQVTTRNIHLLRMKRAKAAVLAVAAAAARHRYPLPSPGSLEEACAQLEALAEAQAEVQEKEKEKKRTRRAGKRVTKRRQREREEKVVRSAQLAGELVREAHIVAGDVGMVLVDIAVNVAV
ncbi:hypothetical protein C8Q73DRAFT_668313 [Cubamyces lactineus]|nr:hypothetical protein C8Q73DRAFT_668313 [Cubamyces lactineus]